ncbi:MAG: Uncharacterized protein G01um101424_236 [Parcubacteria group bacterium Gr01-1014_24]|nr:MAG: Uncharacterized protein G01um101424_236 [Parcubacteria group bacterium Gr01-1014_24]
MKKVIPVFAAVLLMLPCHFAFAGLIINEVMYDLSGADTTGAPSKSREWIEIRNPDGTDVFIDASTWRVYDGSANRTINGEVNFSITAGSYVIFAGDKDTFLLDHSGFSGVVYDTGITTLNNTGATLKLLDQNGSIVDSFTYASSMGGAGDGNSLQKVSGSWVGATPTPGITNEISVTSTAPSGTGSLVYSSLSNDNSSTAATSQTKNKIAEEPKIKTQIAGRTLAFMGMPVELEGNAFGYSGEKLYSGKYFWNFGDGDSREVKMNDSQKFTHTYFYAGEYVVSLEYYLNYYGNVPDASDKIIIKVVPADILISGVGDEKDFFVELSNNTDYEADISKWFLLSDKKSFAIPRNTILEPKKKIIFSPKITNFSISDKNNLKLLNSQGESIFDYSSSIALAAPVKTLIRPKISTNQDSGAVKMLEETPDGQIPVENLPALVIQSDIIKNDSGNMYTIIISLISIIFIGASAGAVYFLRQKKTIPNVGDDFKILDE